MFKQTSFLSSIFIFFVVLLSSCSSVKKVAYFQKLDSPTIATPQSSSTDNYDARVKPKDLLSITVVTSAPESSRIYNLIVPQISDISSQNNLVSQPSLQTYLVDSDGNIDFPVFGLWKVAGFTQKELVAQLQAKLASSFSTERPIVTIRITNYSINVLGEVQRPGKFESKNERITIFEALSMAGDLTIYGQRENVKVLREKANGQKEYINVNLNDKNIIYSPAYYLEQNDVVYVEPNKPKSNSSNFGAAESFGISALSILFSLTSLIVTIVK